MFETELYADKYTDIYLIICILYNSLTEKKHDSYYRMAQWI